MHSASSFCDEYLQRIGWTGECRVDAPTLVSLHETHMLHVPFENIDIARGVAIVLDDDRSFRKVVRARRGGFCYELNGAFAALLRRFGFDVTLISARVANDDRVFGPEFDHLALVVSVGGERFLADVGFGDSFRRPLRLQANVPQDGGDPLGGSFRLTSEDALWCLWRSRGADDAPQYQFTLAARSLADFSEMCAFHQSSPESHFTQKTVCSLATPEGRLTLLRDRLVRTTSAGKEEHLISPGEWQEILASHFGILLRDDDSC